MRKQAIVTLLIGALFSPIYAADNTFLDYQNYNHGYCPDCNRCPCDCPAVPYKSCPQQEGDCPDAPVYNDDIQPCYPDQACEDDGPDAELNIATPIPPCDPSAPVCGTKSGFSVCAIGLSLIAIGAAAAILVTANNGSSSGHN